MKRTLCIVSLTTLSSLAATAQATPATYARCQGTSQLTQAPVTVALGTLEGASSVFSIGLNGTLGLDKLYGQTAVAAGNAHQITYDLTALASTGSYNLDPTAGINIDLPTFATQAAGTLTVDFDRRSAQLALSLGGFADVVTLACDALSTVGS